LYKYIYENCDIFITDNYWIQVCLVCKLNKVLVLSIPFGISTTFCHV